MRTKKVNPREYKTKQKGTSAKHLKKQRGGTSILEFLTHLFQQLFSLPRKAAQKLARLFQRGATSKEAEKESGVPLTQDQRNIFDNLSNAHEIFDKSVVIGDINDIEGLLQPENGSSKNSKTSELFSSSSRDSTSVGQPTVEIIPRNSNSNSQHDNTAADLVENGTSNPVQKNSKTKKKTIQISKYKMNTQKTQNKINKRRLRLGIIPKEGNKPSIFPNSISQHDSIARRN